MLAEFSINPMNTEHMSRDVARVIETLQATGLEFRLGPMGTCVEGDLERVLTAIRRCHQTVAGNHERVITTIVIDDRKTSEESFPVSHAPGWTAVTAIGPPVR
jgi:uncharacterized protein (TIGR00106 family)